MKLFRKRTQDDPQQPGMLSKGFQIVYKHIQNKWAVWMAQRTGHFSRRTWMILLMLFVFAGGTSSIYIAMSSFTPGKGKAPPITPIKKPKHVIETGEAMVISTKLSEDEYSRIKKFRLYMDSLARSPGGQRIYDSIIASRPGLMDSVRFIEDYYQQLKH